MNDPLYRVRQFLRAAHAAPLSAQENERVRAILNEQALALYQSMPMGDQRHSLAILDALESQGHTALPLLQAALLHDVAKRNVGLVHRTGVILLNKLSPGALRTIASDNPQSWRYPFYLSLNHPDLGAAWAAEAGVEHDTIALIRAHQEHNPVFQGPCAPQLQAWHRELKQLDDVS
jgi:hypothetical protein